MLEFKFIYGENGREITEALRAEVFGETSDGNDADAYHFVGYDKLVQIAAARLREVGEECFRIDFVAVKEDYRGQFVGDLVMRALADKAVSLGGKCIILEATAETKGFFEFEEYAVFGSECERDGGKYIMMKKDLTKITPCRGCAK